MAGAVAHSPETSSSGGVARRAPSLQVDHVTKTYGANTVVRDLSFTVQPGRVTGFLGPNGSGKSTTMKILLGLAAADSGRATVDDVPYQELDDPPATVGALLESNAFHPGRSGRNHLRVLADAQRIPLARVDEVLQTIGLGDAVDRRVGAYSLGMRQRLGVAAALLADPPVLVLDEPANGLDPQGIHAMRDLLRSYAAQGRTVLVSSHLLAEMELLADDLIVINRGALVTSGALAELQQRASLVRTPSATTLAELLRTGGADVEVRDDGVTLVVRGPTIESIGEQAAEAGLVLHELSRHAGSLEQRFLAWTSSPTDVHEEVPTP